MSLVTHEILLDFLKQMAIDKVCIDYKILCYKVHGHRQLYHPLVRWLSVLLLLLIFQISSGTEFIY